MKDGREAILWTLIILATISLIGIISAIYLCGWDSFLDTLNQDKQINYIHYYSLGGQK